MDEIIQEIIASYSNGIGANLIPRVFECNVDGHSIQLRFNEAVVLNGLYRYILADFQITGDFPNENMVTYWKTTDILPEDRIRTVYTNFATQREIWEHHLENDDNFRRIVYRNLDEMAVQYDASRIRPVIRKLITDWFTSLQNIVERT